MLRAVVDKQALLAHQQRVVSGNRNPVIKPKASEMETRLNLFAMQVLLIRTSAKA